MERATRNAAGTAAPAYQVDSATANGRAHTTVARDDAADRRRITAATVNGDVAVTRR